MYKDVTKIISLTNGLHSNFRETRTNMLNVQGTPISTKDSTFKQFIKTILLGNIYISYIKIHLCPSRHVLYTE